METLAVHGVSKPYSEGSAIQPIFQSSTFQFQGEVGYDNVRYTRCNNGPNHVALGRNIAALEKTEAAMVASSGMAAISSALLTFLQSGDHLLIQNTCYGGTYDFVTKNLPVWNISHTKIDASRPDSWQAALKPSSKIIYVEAICNPTSDVADLEAVVEFARANNLLAFIDNTFASPVLLRPAELGFDIILESATKYMGGHSDIIAGSFAGSQEHVKRIMSLQNHLGGSLDPNSCFLLQRGLKTLPLRIRQQCCNAHALAAFLQQQPQVDDVSYSGLKGHRDHRLAQKYFSGLPGAVFSFNLKGSLEDGEAFQEALKIPLIAPSLGSVETLVCQPALTSHAGLTCQERKDAGIKDGTIRVAVGIENADDLIADFRQALQAISSSQARPNATSKQNGTLH